ncbi:PREDICTED: sperm-tail PG-rich repeat-containing protein 2, partial [Galeopterus variegatus]|uniref:Sperm-tail PG-rich repeat-containing protein 2 n=1 Tax=Galeopterus variegatus TaxID=482537 RepID=A0ABM0SBL1_GALVR
MRARPGWFSVICPGGGDRRKPCVSPPRVLPRPLCDWGEESGRSPEAASTAVLRGRGAQSAVDILISGYIAGGYAPFLSLTARESAFTVASSTEKAFPGPGHYNVSEAQKISTAPVATRNFDVPSIPSYGQSYGYHINEDGSIIKHFPPASDPTIGPAYYKPQFDVSNATLKYKGIHFGNSLGRQELPKKSGPGPGQYDIEQEKRLHYENINIKKDQQQNYCSFIPRFYDIIILQEEKK